MKSNQGFLNNSCKTHYGQVIVNRPLPGKNINEKTFLERYLWRLPSITYYSAEVQISRKIKRKFYS